MEVAAFVQARMGSSRLPGKSMLPLWREMPMIELVLRRVSASVEVDRIVLATGDQPADDPLAAVAEELGVEVFRGPEHDVLGRFEQALERFPADAVVRVCADNPFVDPAAIDDLVRFFERGQPCDYASNHSDQSGLPDGTGTEILAADALRAAAAEALSAFDREHVPTYIVERPERFSVKHMPPPASPWPFLKLDVDTEDDLGQMRRLAGALPDDGAPLWGVETVVECFKAMPAKPWHPYVFDTERRAFVGDFERMYKAGEEQGFDAWDQSDPHRLDSSVAALLLERISFQSAVDLGCGKGAFTARLKRSDNHVTGVDSSETAVDIAASLFPDLNWVCASAEDYLADCGPVDLVLARELLSYMEGWRELLAACARVARYALIGLYIPPDPIGFVQSHAELEEELERHFEVLEGVMLTRHSIGVYLCAS